MAANVLANRGKGEDLIDRDDPTLAFRQASTGQILAQERMANGRTKDERYIIEPRRQTKADRWVADRKRIARSSYYNRTSIVA
jgi:hypothetical protein